MLLSRTGLSANEPLSESRVMSKQGGLPEEGSPFPVPLLAGMGRGSGNPAKLPGAGLADDGFRVFPYPEPPLLARS